MAEIFGSEKYAPLEQRPGETLRDVERDANIHRQRGGPDTSNDSPAEKLSEIIQRASSASTNEIDLVIRMLENVRDMIGKEGERVSAEIASYVSLSHSATMSMKVITDNLQQWNGMPH